MNIKKRTDQLLEYMKDFRHDIHMYPEIGLQEFRTTDRIAEELDKLGIPYTRFDPTGLMCDITGELPGDKFIGLRADIDAIPMQEASGEPFSSKIPGVMHACAHDMHTAMLLGATRLLHEMRGEFGGKVRCVFQPGEEGAGGAEVIAKQGAMDGPDFFVGIHTWPDCDGAGTVGGFDIIEALAGVSNFKITVKGTQCHGYAPHVGVDALMVGAQIVTALQTIIARRFPPLETGVVTVGIFHAGTATNIIAEEAILEGTIRYHNEELGQKMIAQIKELVEGMAAANGASATVELSTYCPPLKNDPKLERLTYKMADKIWEDSGLGKNPVLNIGKIMGGEDFTVFSRFAPSVYIDIGCGGTALSHQGDFRAEDDTMPFGAAMYVEMSLALLNGAYEDATL